MRKAVSIAFTGCLFFGSVWAAGAEEVFSVHPQTVNPVVSNTSVRTYDKTVNAVPAGCGLAGVSAAIRLYDTNPSLDIFILKKCLRNIQAEIPAL